MQNVFGQSDNYNLNFEKPTENNTIPNWQKKNEGVDITLDSITKFQGKYSLKMNSNNKGDGILGIENIINKTFKGAKIELSGYLKTENIQSAYIYLIVGNEENQLWFDRSPIVSGTSDWQKLSVKIPYTTESTKITIACNIDGSGDVWLDDFKVTIDGKDILDLKPFERKIFPAESDKKFDKGSGITSVSVEKGQIDNLKTLGLIWGFLKYYHPNISKGEFNWDYELFRVLPKVLNSENKEDRDEILIKWISSFGQFSSGKEAKFKSTEVKMLPDLNWINNSTFSDELSTLLVKVKNADRPKEHYYIGLEPKVENPIFKNENSYSSMKYPDPGFRLLSLYRYWNIIQL